MACLKSNMCRLCMSKNNVNIHIFKGNLFHIINALLPTKVSETDSMPKFICIACQSKIIMISEFRKTVRDADIFFQMNINEKHDAHSLRTEHIVSSINFQNFESNKINDSRNDTIIMQSNRKTKDILQSLSHVKGLSIKKITRRNVDKKSDSQILSKSNSSVHINPEVNIKRISNKACPNVLYLPENDKSNFIDENGTDNTNDDNSKDSSMNMGTNKSKKGKAGLIELRTTLMYMCMHCHKKFPRSEQLQEHKNSSLICKNAKLTCKTCGKILKDRKSMHQHLSSHKEKQKYICEECGKIYTNLFNMENHKVIAHGDKVELIRSVYKCRICSLVFLKRNDLFMHVSSHSKEQTFLCDKCGKCFSTEDNLRSHLRTHNETRTYVCGTCAKRFESKMALVQHSHNHSGIKCFICDVCGKAFSKKSSFTSHVKHHIEEEMLFHCDICSKQFLSSEKLKMHMTFHNS